jgi:hypothetical protein
MAAQATTPHTIIKKIFLKFLLIWRFSSAAGARRLAPFQNYWRAFSIGGLRHLSPVAGEADFWRRMAAFLTQLA